MITLQTEMQREHTLSSISLHEKSQDVIKTGNKFAVRFMIFSSKDAPVLKVVELTCRPLLKSLILKKSLYCQKELLSGHEILPIDFFSA
jgi:hypothetical protein